MRQVGIRVAERAREGIADSVREFTGKDEYKFGAPIAYIQVRCAYNRRDAPAPEPNPARALYRTGR